MDFRFIFGKRFLKRSFGDVASSMDGYSCAQFRQALKDNSAVYIPNCVFNSKDVDLLFNAIDGTKIERDLSGNFSSSVPQAKNNRIERQELVDWVKMNYETFTGKRISDEELTAMPMSRFMSVVEEMLNNGYKLKS